MLVTGNFLHEDEILSVLDQVLGKERESMTFEDFNAFMSQLNQKMFSSIETDPEREISLEGLFTEEELANMSNEDIEKLLMQANELAKGFSI
jgi:hypothetical protein